MENGYGTFVSVRGGTVVREFLDGPHNPETNVDRGSSGVEGEPVADWMDVASFVEADELGFGD